MTGHKGQGGRVAGGAGRRGQHPAGSRRRGPRLGRGGAEWGAVPPGRASTGGAGRGRDGAGRPHLTPAASPARPPPPGLLKRDIGGLRAADGGAVGVGVRPPWICGRG